MKKIFYLFAAICSFSFVINAQVHSDAALRRIVQQDQASRDASGKLSTLSAAEHALRADVYSTNRQFPQAREHWQKILDVYPNDAVVPKTLFGIARSYMWEREYEKAVFWFDKLTKDFLNSKDGREGLAFKGASYVRMNKHAEAARTYEQYIVMFPTGERVETSYLNLIESLRETRKYDEANQWIEKARTRFAGMATETNALHARLRMELHRQNYAEAVRAADVLLNRRNFANSMASADEVKYLKGLALEKLNRKTEAIAVYSSIPSSLSSYYSGLAAEKLAKLNGGQIQKIVAVSSSLERDYPVMYRADLLRSAKSRGVDPRFVLAIMKQESSFRANAKSPAAARGLLQLVYDTAVKYNKKAGYNNFQADDLYQPSVNIAIGSVYIAELKDEFGGMYEAIAASYNGGEDNAARWLERSRPKEPGVFASEVGFSETKNYVFKVMNNYQVYRELYTEDLMKR
ncbi:MAG TPA: transglycosylase SLT domain-containing protein [Pyrinomonadaceae bacterium]|jgi:soluble lytic murein transglycosylase